MRRDRPPNHLLASERGSIKKTILFWALHSKFGIEKSEEEFES
jgi:hypothetical protein